LPALGKEAVEGMYAAAAFEIPYGMRPQASRQD